MVTISMLQRAVQNNLVSNKPKILKSQRWFGFTRWSHITLNIFNPVNIGYVYIYIYFTKVCIYIYICWKISGWASSKSVCSKSCSLPTFCFWMIFGKRPITIGDIKMPLEGTTIGLLSCSAWGVSRIMGSWCGGSYKQRNYALRSHPAILAPQQWVPGFTRGAMLGISCRPMIWQSRRQGIQFLMCPDLC